MMPEAAIAAARFGLGPRRGEAPPERPRDWLAAQLEAPDPTPVAGRPSSADGLALWVAVRQENRPAVAQAAAGEAMAAPTTVGQAPPEQAAPGPDLDDEARLRLRQHIHAEELDYLGNALVTPAPFRERLVWFWTNHFTVAARTRPTAATAGAYVREAIRPHVTGRFADMLLAVMRHPAMLSYLDQAGSVGPDSRAGLRQHRGLNENLARECLELHTVTPASGYTQADVTAFARLLTGWSLQLAHPPYGYVYRPYAHEPGAQTVLGHSWTGGFADAADAVPDMDGEAAGEAALRYLADHPATHRHLAEKLVRHFVADDPPPGQVAVIEATLRRSGGDLGAASRALIDLPGAWVPLAKLRTPQDYVVAGLRALGATPDQVPHLPGMVAQLGQPLFGAPFPIGWPDRAADWAGPEAMLQRVDFAYGLAGRGQSLDPASVAAEQLGPLQTEALRDAMARAGSRQDALTLLFASPEFQRR